MYIGCGPGGLVADMKKQEDSETEKIRLWGYVLRLRLSWSINPLPSGKRSHNELEHHHAING